MHGAQGLVEAAGARAARYQDVARRQHGGVEMPAGECHRAGVHPLRIRLIEVDDLGRVRRGVAPAHVENLPRLVHYRGSVIAPAELPDRAVGPASGACDVEVAGWLPVSRVEDAP